MKATKYLSLAALALMGTLASCQSDDEAAASFARPDNAVGINVTVGSLKGTTRSNPAATDDTQREFNLGDQISVSTDGQDPVLFQCQDADMQTWAEAEAGKFLLWTQNEMTFKAYYPATTGTSMTAFTLPADQSSADKIAQADYMTGQRTCDNENGTDITLYLERKTARVIVRINDFTDQYDNDEKTVSNVRIYSEASGIEYDNPTGSSIEIQPYAQGTGGQGSTYTALVVPGWGDEGATFIQLTDGEGNTLRVKGIPELEAGYSYTYNLTVGKNRINVASVTVQDWTTGTTLAGGQAQEQTATARALAEATTDDIGKIAGADGNIYDTKAAAEAVATGNAVAMIAYVGSASDCTHGLAIALADESGTKTWSAAGAACSGKTAVTGGTWRLPSIKDWQYMFIGCGASGSYSGFPGTMSYSELDTKLTTANGTALQTASYWSSTESSPGEDAWSLYFSGGSASFFDGDYEGGAYPIRACLAF